MLNSKSQMEKSLHVIVPWISATHLTESTAQKGGREGGGGMKGEENKTQPSNANI